MNESFSLLPNPEEPLRAVSRAQRVVTNCNVNEMLEGDGAALHEFIDDVQADLGEIHQQLSKTWFEFG